MVYLSTRYAFFKRLLQSRTHVDLHHTEPVPLLPEAEAWLGRFVGRTKVFFVPSPRLHTPAGGHPAPAAMAASPALRQPASAALSKVQRGPARPGHTTQERLE